MRLIRLRLENFRCWPEFCHDLDSGVTLLVGPNGVGKSTILEAASVSAGYGSFRGAKLDELIRFNASLLRVCSDWEDANGGFATSITLEPGQAPQAQLRGHSVSPSALASEVLLSVFTESDAWLIKGDPSLRRRFLNMECGALWPKASAALAAYRALLRQKNALLGAAKRQQAEPDYLTLQAINRQMAPLIAYLTERRGHLLTLLEPVAQQVFLEYFGTGAITVLYQPSVLIPPGEEPGDQLFLELERCSQRDVAFGAQTIGPQRDDFGIRLEGKPLREYGSSGECGGAALALKIAALENLAAQKGEQPLVLADDPAPELDDSRRSAALRRLCAGRQMVLALHSDSWLQLDVAERLDLLRG
jgi:DNA replication and repair protein RecF